MRLPPPLRWIVRWWPGGRRRGQQRPARHTVTTPYSDVLDFLLGEGRLPALVESLGDSIQDLFSLCRVNRATWAALACDHALWRRLYVRNDPLVTPALRKRLLRDQYMRGATRSVAEALPRSGLQQSAWMRCCARLFAKPRLVLVMGGRDPVVVRRLGEPEQSARSVWLGLDYRLDTYLDDDARRFEEEFPQVFQDLDPGDLVVTQDTKGAGLFTASRDAESAPFVRLRKAGRDSEGFGVLSRSHAPPWFPLFYYADATVEEVAAMEDCRRQLLRRQVYFYSHTALQDKSLFSWHTLELLEAL